MRSDTYTITKSYGKTDWSAIPAIPIDRVLWSDDTGIRAQGQLCYSSDRLFVHQRAVEEHIRAEHTEPLSPVYEDSCLEFFFMHEQDENYFNFEINPNGCMYAQYGSSDERESIAVSGADSLFDIQTGRTADGWEVFYSIPLDFMQTYSPNFEFTGRLFANMYKCGNKTVNIHFLSWAQIELEKPNFHCPEFFGTMVFEDR